MLMIDDVDRNLEKSRKESLQREIQILEDLSSGPLSESVDTKDRMYYFRKLQEAKS
jgi:hypothetical protein